MKNVRLFTVAAALGMFASTVVAAEPKTTVKWTDTDSVIKVDLGEKIITKAPTATVTVDSTKEVEESVYAIDPDLNEEQGWTYTDAMFWNEAKDAISQLTLGGLRVLEPNAGENEGKFYNQATGETLTQEEITTKLTDAGLLAVHYDADGDVNYIDINPVPLYTSAKTEIVAKYLVVRFQPVKNKYDEETIRAAIVALTNGLDGLRDIDIDGVQYWWAVKDAELAPRVYNYATVGTPSVNLGAGSAIYVESYKDTYVQVGYNRTAAAASKTYTPSANPVAAFAADTDYTVADGSVFLNSKNMQYLNKVVYDARAVGTADGTQKDSALTYFTDGSAIVSSETYYVGGKNVKTATGTFSYTGFDAIAVRNTETGTDVIYKAEDLVGLTNKSFTNLAAGGAMDLLTKIDAETGDTLTVGTNAICEATEFDLTLKIASAAEPAVKGYVTFDFTAWASGDTATIAGVNLDYNGGDANVTAIAAKMNADTTFKATYEATADAAAKTVKIQQKVAAAISTSALEALETADANSHVAPASGTTAGKLAVAAGALSKGTLLVKDSTAANNDVYATTGEDPLFRRATTADKGETLYYVTEVKSGKVTYKAVGEVYDLSDASKTTERPNSTLVWGEKYKYTDPNTGTVETITIGSATDGVQVLTAATIANIDKNNTATNADDTVYVAAEKAEKADTIYDSISYGFYPLGSLYSVTVTSNATNKLYKETAINIINVDSDVTMRDHDGFYRISSITPEIAKVGAVKGDYKWNDKLGKFEFVEATPTDQEVDLSDLTLTAYYLDATHKATTKNLSDVLDYGHTNGGYYYVASPENDTDSYVLYGGKTSGLNLPVAGVNQTKSEMSLELPDGTNTTVKAVELTTGKKETTWFPAFDNQEELNELLVKLAGLDKALVGSSTDTTKSTFKIWYTAAKADVDAKIVDTTLPTAATKKVDKAVSSDSAEVTVSSNLSEIDTTVAGVKTLTYTAKYNGEEVGTKEVTVIVTPNYSRTWKNGRVATLTSYYVSDPTAKYAFYEYNWDAKTATVTFYNLDGSVADTTTVAL